jgi:predicted TIM-barrel enzyme
MHHVRVIEDLVHEHAEAFVRQFLAPAHRERMLALTATAVTIGGHQAGDVAGPLGEALQSVAGQAYGALVSCVPGVLAYYESEDCERFLLHRPG